MKAKPINIHITLSPKVVEILKKKGYIIDDLTKLVNIHAVWVDSTVMDRMSVRFCDAEKEPYTEIAYEAIDLFDGEIKLTLKESPM